MTSKRKTKQLRWLVTGLMLAMTMVMPASTWANVMYTVYDNGKLTFKYGDKPQGSRNVYDVPTDPTNPGWIIDHKADITNVVFDESFKDARPTSCYHWFEDFNSLTTIEGIENLNTDEVTDMSYMFYNCSKLPSLDVSKFNTAKVENMCCMFSFCEVLTSLDVSKFITEKVKDMGAMFGYCSGLTSLDVSNFNTDNVTNMGYMFANCSKLTSTSLDVSKFNTANVTDMSYMFYNCSGLTSLTLSSFNTDKVENMSYMFSDCKKLTSLDLLKFNTANVKNMNFMFRDCSSLESLDLSSFNTANVTNMEYMFYICSGLKTIYVSDDFTTGIGTKSTGMFENCTKLNGAVAYDSNKTDKDMANYNTGYFKTYYKLGENQVDLYGVSLTTESLDLSGEKDFVAHAPFTANEANYSRDLSKSESTWFSLCLPFAYTPYNFTAYKLMSATANAVEIEEITGEIVAGTPVLFKFKGGVVDVNKKINISATKAEIVKAPVDGTKVTDPDGSSLQLCGTYQNKSFSEKDNNAFILLNNKLMNPAKMLENKNVKKVSVKPFRAYMTLTAPAQTSSARAFSIGHGGEGNEGTTAIDLLNSVATDDAEYYDINGRRIDAPAKGVNIVRRGNKTIKLIIK